MARQRIGTSNASSLIRSAVAAANKTADYTDQIKGYEFQQSDKSQQAYDTYTSYLKQRQAAATDPTKQLSFIKAQDSAFKGFKSSEIQRAQLAVNYGSGSLYDKADKIKSLMEQAASIGDDATYQSLDLQRTNLDIQIQNMEEKAANAGSGGAGSSSYETQAGTNLNKTYGVLNDGASHFKAQLDSGQISYADYNHGMQQIAMKQRELSSQVYAEQEARKNGGSTGNPNVSSLSESDLNAVLKHADSFFTGETSKKYSPEMLTRAANGMQDYGVSYDAQGNPGTFAVPQVANFQTTDKSGSPDPASPDFNPNYGKPFTGATYAQGDTGSGKFIAHIKDASGNVISQEVATKDHAADFTHTPYKTITVHQADGTAKQLIEMRVDTGRKDANGAAIMKDIHVDPTKPGATQFLQDWASNNNSWNAGVNKATIAANENPILQGINELGNNIGQGYLNYGKSLAKGTGDLFMGGVNGIGDAFKHDKNAMNVWDDLQHPDHFLKNPGGSLVDAAMAASKAPRHFLAGGVGGQLGALQSMLFGRNEKVKADTLAKAKADAAAAEALRVSNYNTAIAQQAKLGVNNAPLPVKSPGMVAAATPNVAVTNRQVGINAQPSLAVQPTPAQPSVKVVGPAYKAPAPTPWYKSGAVGAVGSFTHLW